MTARSKSRFTTAQAGWIALVIFGAWLVFLLMPVPRKAKPVASRVLPSVQAQSKLESVGLANNPDWFGLPDYFAIWEEQVDWESNMTWFAYWNPGSQSYTYFFEAKRSGDKVSFRAMTIREVSARELEWWGPGIRPGSDAMDLHESPSHPFVFLRKKSVGYRHEPRPDNSFRLVSGPTPEEKRPSAPDLKVNLPVPPSPTLPKLDLPDGK